MSKIEEVRTAMMAALKAGDKPRKDALSLLLSALKNKQIDKREELTQDEESAVVYKEIKEAQETLDTTPAERTDIIGEASCAWPYGRRLRPSGVGDALEVRWWWRKPWPSWAAGWGRKIRAS